MSNIKRLYNCEAIFFSHPTLYQKVAYKIIEEARKKAKMTQEELAKKIGTNKSYISRVETGKTEPKVSTFYRIASALGMTVELTPAM